MTTATQVGTALFLGFLAALAAVYAAGYFAVHPATHSGRIMPKSRSQRVVSELYYKLTNIFRKTEPVGRISEIYVHPIKSIRGVSLKKCSLDSNGFKYDRLYMFAHPTPTPKPGTEAKPNSHTILTQRENPKMALITPLIEEKQFIDSKDGKDGKSGDLILNFPDTDSVTIPLEPQEEHFLPDSVTIDIWGDIITCKVIKPELIGPKFIQNVGFPEGTVLLFPQQRRAVYKGILPNSERGKSTTNFQDGYPGNFVTTQSLKDLNKRLEDIESDVRVTARNFRPNIVIDNPDWAPFAEDNWKQLTIGSLRCHVTCRNVRCQVTTVNVSKGQFEPTREPYKTMQKYRRVDAGSPYSPCFGMNFVYEGEGGIVQVGDEVFLHSLCEHYYVA